MVIGFFMPLPLAMMIPFMGIQSAVMAKQFGENFQYGKRRISAMSNEEFNKLTPTLLMQRANEELKDMIPSMKSSIVEMRDFQTFLIGEFIKMVNDAIGRGLGSLFGFDPKQVFPDQGSEIDYFDPGNPDKDFVPGNPQPPSSTVSDREIDESHGNTAANRARAQRNIALLEKAGAVERADIVLFKNYKNANDSYNDLLVKLKKDTRALFDRFGGKGKGYTVGVSKLNAEFGALVRRKDATRRRAIDAITKGSSFAKYSKWLATQ